MLVIPARGKQKQEDHEFWASLGYIVRLVSKTNGWECSSAVESLPSMCRCTGF
jgi:hypothetical protein